LAVHIFGIHKDEPGVLMDWVKHHSRIVGSKNIHLIDNKSELPEVKSMLGKIVESGIDLIRFKGPFSEKHTVLTSLMSEYNVPGTMLVPLDIDEFLVANMPQDKFSINHTLILRRFNEAPRDKMGKYKFTAYEALKCNVTTEDAFVKRANHFKHVPLTCRDKTFYLGGRFISTDQGNHHGEVKDQTAYCNKYPSGATGQKAKLRCQECFHVDTGVGVVHFGSKILSGGERMAKCTNLMAVYNYTDLVSGFTNKKQCFGLHGRHHCEYLVRHRNDPPHAEDALLNVPMECLESDSVHRYNGFKETLYSQ